MKSPVLILDLLGISNKIKNASDEDTLRDIINLLMNISGAVQAMMPDAKISIQNNGSNSEWTVDFSSSDFEYFQIQDMFCFFLKNTTPSTSEFNQVLGTALRAYQAALFCCQMPRGAIGYGEILFKNNIIVGNGFLDAYIHGDGEEAPAFCGIKLSPNFIKEYPTEYFQVLLKSNHIVEYKNDFFVNPFFNGKIDESYRQLQKTSLNGNKMTETLSFYNKCKGLKLG